MSESKRNEKMAEARLKPCPFCGSKSDFLLYMGDAQRSQIICRKCETFGPRESNEKEAIKSWNTRLWRQKSKKSKTIIHGRLLGPKDWDEFERGKK